MWVPSTAQEVEDAVNTGNVEESPSIDAKVELPTSKKNIEIAKDVAAMATDGGVLIYGVGEDENDAVSVLRPIELRGVPERISQVVSTSIAEVPFIDIKTLPCEDPIRGYVVVVVPQSARAPHMVTVNGDHRYYGREAKANRILNEGDVARLYERRQRWAVDREQVLREVIASPPVPGRPEQAYVYAFTRPAALDPGIFEQAQATMTDGVVQTLLPVVRSTVLRGKYGPSLESAPYFDRHGGDMWRWATSPREEIARADFDPGNLSTIDFNLDGRAQMFCGRATDSMMNAPEHRFIIEAVIAGNVEAFFAVMATVYDAAGYRGAVDVGLAIVGLKGAQSERARRGFPRPVPHTYPVDAYTRTARIAAAELRDAPALGQRLLRHFFEASTEIEGYNPWTQPNDR
jgi:hypothetical protein